MSWFKLLQRSIALPTTGTARGGLVLILASFPGDRPAIFDGWRIFMCPYSHLREPHKQVRVFRKTSLTHAPGSSTRRTLDLQNLGQPSGISSCSLTEEGFRLKSQSNLNVLKA
ncbi:MAG: hypothetical protein HC769_26505 [Cyanobacteria bacterium CRU_2_1]|nr:hypothetical protein [Cyanobacteria bacterium CRU_2_1]